MLNRPELHQHLRYAYSVFWDLNDTRTSGMSGVCRLTLLEFEAYCRLHHIPLRDAGDLWEQVRILDRTLVNHINAKHAADMERKKKA